MLVLSVFSHDDNLDLDRLTWHNTNLRRAWKYAEKVWRKLHKAFMAKNGEDEGDRGAGRGGRKVGGGGWVWARSWLFVSGYVCGSGMDGASMKSLLKGCGVLIVHCFVVMSSSTCAEHP